MKFAKFIFTSFLGLFAMQSAFAADCPMGVAITASTVCTVPAGVTRIRIEAWGGGGGGGFENSDDGGPGGGGGGGSYCARVFDVTPPGDLGIGIGAGGTAGFNDSNQGAVGGTTSVTVNGILVGLNAGGGGGGDFDNPGSGGTVDECTATGATRFQGGSGRSGISVDYSGGGGGSASSSSVGGDAPSSGTGGIGQGSGGNGSIGDPASITASTMGSVPGGGGGGGDRYVFPAGGGLIRLDASAGAGGQVILTALSNPTAIPTLSEWALICLSGLLGLLAAGRIRRRL